MSVETGVTFGYGFVREEEVSKLGAILGLSEEDQWEYGVEEYTEYLSELGYPSLEIVWGGDAYAGTENYGIFVKGSARVLSHQYDNISHSIPVDSIPLAGIQELKAFANAYQIPKNTVGWKLMLTCF